MSARNLPERLAFSETSDPRAYVPRAATESILAALGEWIDSGVTGVTLGALIAPPGLGKTFLLRLLEARISARPWSGEALYLPYAGMMLPDLSAWVHGLLGRTPAAPDGDADALSAIAALTALAEDASEPFFLLIDDAESMPLDTARILSQGLPSTGSPLRLLLALNEDARATRLLAALGELRPIEFHFRSPMTEPETKVYVRGRMRWAGVAPDVIDRLEKDAGMRIHALSGGVPRRVHRLASDEIERRVESAQRSGHEDWRRSEWMGRPLDDED